MRRFTPCAVAITSIALLVPAAASAQVKESVIDFESISSPVSPTGEGLVISQLSSGNGISGDVLSGFAGVFGFNPLDADGTNYALIFDSTCTVDGAGGTPADCSGEDSDLHEPSLGNTMIVAEDLRDGNRNGRIDDPDDADRRGQYLDFDLSTLEDGNFDVKSLDILDVDDDENTGRVELYDDGNIVGSTPIPVVGDNVMQTLVLNGEGADRIKVVLAGSAAIDNIRLRTGEDEPTGLDGCTPGFWKNHTGAWQGYTTTQKFDDVFGVSYNANLTLLGALNQGGGGFAALGRHATAGLLNAKHADVAYGLTSAQIIAAVQAAFASGDPTAAHNQLEDLNERTCTVQNANLYKGKS